MEIYIKLFLVALLPVVASALFYLLQSKTSFGGKQNFWLGQIIIGVVFGVLAVFGTEYGVNIGEATANARDAAPLCAGLLFGAPAGIIAGVIGGVERWFAAYWGAGMYSQIACSVSTALAGLYAGLLRKYYLDNRRPGFVFGAISAVVMEVIHLSILFLTHINDAEKAYEIVKITTFPMIGVNAVSVGLAILVVNLFSKGFNRGHRHIRTIAEKVQRVMLICVFIAYMLTTAFVFVLQTSSAETQIKDFLTQGVRNVSNEINNANTDVTKIANYHDVGIGGYILVAEHDGTIVSGGSLKRGMTLKAVGINITAETPEYTQLKGICSGDGIKESCFWMYAAESEYYIVAVIPEEKAYERRDAESYVNLYMEIIVFAMIFGLIYMLLKKIVIKSIRKVNDGLERIIDGDLDTKVEVYSTKEFNMLSNSINTTVTTLKRYIAEAEDRIAKELEFARNIQLSALPPAFPAFPDKKSVELFATMDTAKEVGGDFYDAYFIDDNKLAFLIADVSGKGIPAAMFMMRAKTMIRNYAEEGKPVNEIIELANTHLCEGNEANMFVTAWMGILDTETGHLEFTNAGHNAPVIIRADGSSEFLKSTPGLVLAALDGVKYKKQEMELAEGDRLFLYTDGVTEANDISETLYGEPRLLSYLTQNSELSGGELLKGLKADIDAFAGEAEQFDDITMLSLRYK